MWGLLESTGKNLRGQNDLGIDWGEWRGGEKQKYCIVSASVTFDPIFIIFFFFFFFDPIFILHLLTPRKDELNHITLRPNWRKSLQS